MGVDCEGVGGVGVRLTDEMIDKIKLHESITEEDWDEDPDYWLSRLNLSYDMAGNLFSGDPLYYLFVPGTTLGRVNANAKSFCKRLAEFGIMVKPDELEIISDSCIS